MNQVSHTVLALVSCPPSISGVALKKVKLFLARSEMSMIVHARKGGGHNNVCVDKILQKWYIGYLCQNIYVKKYKCKHSLSYQDYVLE